MEKQKSKTGILVVLLVVAIIVIAIMGVIIYKFYNEKNDFSNKSVELKSQVDSLNEKISKQDNYDDEKFTNSVSDKKSEQSKKLTDSEEKELFNKAVKDNMVFIDGMISTKDFTKKSFTDKEIIALLPDSSEDDIFSSYNDDSGIYKKASISDVEKSAKKLFNKTINVKSIKNDDSIRVEDDNVIIEARSGVGIADAELLSIETIGDEEYVIEFKYISGDEEKGTYKLTVNYDNENVVYVALEK